MLGAFMLPELVYGLAAIEDGYFSSSSGVVIGAQECPRDAES